MDSRGSSPRSGVVGKALFHEKDYSKVERSGSETLRLMANCVILANATILRERKLLPDIFFKQYKVYGDVKGYIVNEESPEGKRLAAKLNACRQPIEDKLLHKLAIVVEEVLHTRAVETFIWSFSYDTATMTARAEIGYGTRKSSFTVNYENMPETCQQFCKLFHKLQEILDGLDPLPEGMVPSMKVAYRGDPEFVDGFQRVEEFVNVEQIHVDSVAFPQNNGCQLSYASKYAINYRDNPRENPNYEVDYHADDYSNRSDPQIEAPRQNTMGQEDMDCSNANPTVEEAVPMEIDEFGNAGRGEISSMNCEPNNTTIADERRVLKSEFIEGNNKQHEVSSKEKENSPKRRSKGSNDKPAKKAKPSRKSGQKDQEDHRKDDKGIQKEQDNRDKRVDRENRNGSKKNETEIQKKLEVDRNVYGISAPLPVKKKAARRSQRLATNDMDPEENQSLPSNEQEPTENMEGLEEPTENMEGLEEPTENEEAPEEQQESLKFGRVRSLLEIEPTEPDVPELVDPAKEVHIAFDQGESKRFGRGARIARVETAEINVASEEKLSEKSSTKFGRVHSLLDIVDQASALQPDVDAPSLNPSPKAPAQEAPSRDSSPVATVRRFARVPSVLNLVSSVEAENNQANDAIDSDQEEVSEKSSLRYGRVRSLKETVESQEESKKYGRSSSLLPINKSPEK